MNLLLFILVIIVSFIVVRVGAIAFELTGLEWSLAKFQSLSCFTGTGFTTKEAELITGNPSRRKIASVLMILGNAGLVTLIATFANSLRPVMSVPEIEIPFLHLIFPFWLLPVVNLVIIIVSTYFIYKVFTNSKFTKKLTGFLKVKIIQRDIVKMVSFEELLVSSGGYGLISINIEQDNPILNKELKDSELKKEDMVVLAIEREKTTIPNPKPETKILLGDRLICFGRLDYIKQKSNT
jgi:hypothetical protein